MNMVNEFKDEKIELMFDKWEFDKLKKKFCKILLSNFTNPEERTYKETKYLVFNGCFLKNNYHKVIPMKSVIFWFSKRAFKNAIIKLVEFKNLDTNKIYNLKCDITRLNKLDLIIQDLTILD